MNISLPVSERFLQDAVIELARLNKYLVAHFRPAQTNKGWRTAMTGDTGFVDLVLVRAGKHPRLLFVELKSGNGVVRPDQRAWLSALSAAADETDNVSVYLWRPHDLRDGTIERALKGPR